MIKSHSHIRFVHTLYEYMSLALIHYVIIQCDPDRCKLWQNSRLYRGIVHCNVLLKKKHVTKMALETIFALRKFGKMKVFLTDRKGHAQSL